MTISQIAKSTKTGLAEGTIDIPKLGWAKPDLWGLGGDRRVMVHSEGFLRCTMTFLQGLKDPVLPNLT